MRLVLASSSPRRRELLGEAGYHFETLVPSHSAECGVCSQEAPPELVARLAYQKAGDVAAQLHAREPVYTLGDRLVIGCDTVAECAGQILGKPVDEPHARTMLRLLRGREHHVYSGLCLWPVPLGEIHVRVERTTLHMVAFSDNQLEEYLESRLWEGKAGAFGYQDRVGWLTIVEGNESNVVGLPLDLLRNMLASIKNSAD